MKRIVVVGTGTGVGKTALSVALLEQLTTAGHRALGLKPIESGVSSDHPEATDATRLGAAAGHPPRCLFALREALSPHLAAEHEGRVIHVGEVLAWIDLQEREADPTGWSLVETAGGLCTPLGLSVSNLELVAGLRASHILLVAPNRLGVLHDVLACVAVLRHRSLAPALVVLTDALGRDASSDTNARELTRLTQRPALEYTPAVGASHALAWLAGKEPLRDLLEPAARSD